MTTGVTQQILASQLELADLLRAGRDRMWEPQELPGRYGRVVRALDRLLEALDGEAVVAGGWAVWRHGYLGRVTQDVDIVVPAGLVDALIRAASVGGFEVPPRGVGMWPSLRHKESDIRVDLLPEGATPGSSSRPAPTTIPHPSRLGARPGALRYIDLPGLVELKLAAGRVRDESDVVELILANPDQIDAIRQRLGAAHAQYVARFDELLTRAREQTTR
jgi:hypothetical protein